MSGEAVFTLIVIGVMLVALVREWFAPDVVLFSALGVLLVSGVLTPDEALAGFSNQGMLTVAILFIVAYAAQSSGILGVAAKMVMGDGTHPRRALLRMLAPVVAMSAFLNNTPVVAMFVPAVRDWALRAKRPPSKFLMPLSYAAIFGGICTLIGTSTNLVVDGMLRQGTGESIGMFELAFIGLPCALGGMVYLLLVGYHQLPSNPDVAEALQASGREYLVEMMVQPHSPLVGKNVEAAGLRNLEGLFLAEVIRNGESLVPVKPDDIIRSGDRLVFTGEVDAIVELQKKRGLVPTHEHHFYEKILHSGRGRILEAVVSRASPMLGKTIREGEFRARYDAAILAVHRNGERIDTQIGQIVLRPGDTLLLLSGGDFLKRWNQSRDFYMISQVSEAPLANPRKSLLSLAAVGGMVLLAGTGVLSILQAAIVAAIFLLVTGCISVVEARRSIEFNVIVVIAASLGIGRALEQTGAAACLAQQVVQFASGLGPVGYLAAIYIVTSVLTEVITNNAAAVLVFPVAISVAAQVGLDPKPFAIAVAVGASASFSSPIGYQTNLMVHGPGGYRFRDFIRVGLPLNALYLVASVILIPLVWSL